MLRLAMCISLLTGCGRLEFSAVAGSAIDAAVAIDTAPPLCATDGVACDDLDICTPSSTCTGGICTAPPAGPCEKANSESEFAATPGVKGWYYGAWNTSLDADGLYDPDTDFEAFAYWPGDNSWRPVDYADTGPTFTWAYVAPWGGHPASYPYVRMTARRWISDVSGHATLVLHLHKADANGGNGTALHAFVDGLGVFYRAVDGYDSVGYTVNVPVELAVGTRVDVMLDSLGDDGIDTSTWSVRVDSR